MTANATLAGRLVGPRVVNAFIRFNLDGDGYSDASTVPRENGQFSFTPSYLTLGQRTVQARSTRYDDLTAPCVFYCPATCSTNS